MVWQTKKNDGLSAVIGVWGWKYDFPSTTKSHEVNHGLKGYSVSCEWRFAFTRLSHSSSQSASGCSDVPVLTGKLTMDPATHNPVGKPAVIEKVEGGQFVFVQGVTAQ